MSKLTMVGVHRPNTPAPLCWGGCGRRIVDGIKYYCTQTAECIDASNKGRVFCLECATNHSSNHQHLEMQ